MGKLGRFACIFTPMALTIASLACLVLIFVAGLTKNDAGLQSYYNFRTDTSQFKANPLIVNGKNTTAGTLLGSLVGSASSNQLYDFYEVYMWNYCMGTNSSGNDLINACTHRESAFVFNPFQVWGLNGTLVQKDIPGAINSAMNAYTKGAKFMFIAYVIAFWLTAGSILTGIFSICSRWGSCVTTIVSGAATLFTILSALASTIIFSTLVGALNASLREYNVKTSLGTKKLAVEWLAVAFSLGASLFWFISICCCSGRSARKERHAAAPGGGNTFKPFASRGYQPLGDEGAHHQQTTAYGANRGMEMQDFGSGPYKGRDTAYEPFRHGGV